MSKSVRLKALLLYNLTLNSFSAVKYVILHTCSQFYLLSFLKNSIFIQSSMTSQKASVQVSSGNLNFLLSCVLPAEVYWLGRKAKQGDTCVCPIELSLVGLTNPDTEELSEAVGYFRLSCCHNTMTRQKPRQAGVGERICLEITEVNNTQAFVSRTWKDLYRMQLTNQDLCVYMK